MNDHRQPYRSAAPAPAPTRRRFLQGATAIGAGLTLAGLDPLRLFAAAPVAAGSCAETVQDILNAALVAEQIATTLYYTGLTTPALVGSDKLAGASANPNAVAPNGSPQNVAYMQAALDQEQKHAAALIQMGAVSPYTQFYFPRDTFQELGYTSRAGTFLWVLDRLETAFISAYIAAVKRLGALGHLDLAVTVVRILGVECQHRTLFRVIAGDDPADNVTLEVAEFSCVQDALAALQPYVTGRRFPNGVTPPIALPTLAQTIPVIGKNRSS